MLYDDSLHIPTTSTTIPLLFFLFCLLISNYLINVHL